MMTLPQTFFDAQMLVWIRGQLENVQKLYYSISALAPSGGSGMNLPRGASPIALTALTNPAVFPH